MDDSLDEISKHIEPEWKKIRDVRDLPEVDRRCLFRLNSGYVFYGRRTGRKKVTVLLTQKEIPMVDIDAWSGEDVIEADGAEERIKKRLENLKLISILKIRNEI